MREKNVILKNKVIFVTGVAGFIGSNLVKELLCEVQPVHIIGIDNMNDYYDVSIKEYRLRQIALCRGLTLWSTTKKDKAELKDL